MYDYTNLEILISTNKGAGTKWLIVLLGYPSNGINTWMEMSFYVPNIILLLGYFLSIYEHGFCGFACTIGIIAIIIIGCNIINGVEYIICTTPTVGNYI